jgi:hypothetical protein
MVYCRNKHQRCDLIKYIFVNIFSKNNKVFDTKNIKLAILIKKHWSPETNIKKRGVI